MIGMDLYPAGFAPAGCPSVVAQNLPFGQGNSGELQLNTAPRLPASSIASAAGAEADAPLSDDEMAMLGRLLGAISLADDDVVKAPESTNAGTSSSGSVSASMPGFPASMPVAQSSQNIATARANAQPVATEMVRRLQACSSPEEAQMQVSEMLVTLDHEKQQRTDQVNAERLRSLQGANRVLLRGFRNLHKRQQQMEAERNIAEERFASMAAELSRTQAALQASERANSNLQYHLQLTMNGNPGIAAGGV